MNEPIPQARVQQTRFGGLEKLKGKAESGVASRLGCMKKGPSLWIILAQIIGFKNGLWMLHFWVSCAVRYLKFHFLLWAALILIVCGLVHSSRGESQLENEPRIRLLFHSDSPFVFITVPELGCLWRCVQIGYQEWNFNSSLALSEPLSQMSFTMCWLECFDHKPLVIARN